MAQLKSFVHFEVDELREIVGAAVDEYTVAIAEELLERYVAGAPRASGAFADSITAVLRRSGRLADIIFESDRPRAVFIERSRYPIVPTLRPEIGDILRQVLRSVDLDAVARRTGRSREQLARRLHARGVYVGRSRASRPSARDYRRRRTGYAVRRNLRRGIRAGRRFAR